MKKAFPMFVPVFLLGVFALAFPSEARRTLGKPVFSAGMPRRYVLWEEKGVFRLRTTTAKVMNRFSGAIHAVDGRFEKVALIRLDKGDYAKLSPDRSRLFFSFTTVKGVDGLNFTASGKGLAFFLNINSRKAVPKAEVFLGKNGLHPLRNPFAIGLGGQNGEEPVVGLEEGKPEPGDMEVTDLVPAGELEEESKAAD
jgi:hypothetical protein